LGPHKQSSAASGAACQTSALTSTIGCGDGDLVFIECRLHARIGGTVTEWPNVNRLVLHDGKAIERVTYFDPLAILPTLLRHPSIWWRWWRSGVTSPPRSRRH
jgi:hypothetical protein